MKLSAIISILGGVLDGADLDINDVSSINSSTNKDITFLTDAKYVNDLNSSAAIAVIIHEKQASLVNNKSKIVVKNPLLYFAKLKNILHPNKRLVPEISKSAHISDKVILGKNVAISNNVTINSNSQIGNNCQIYPNVYIGSNVILGEDVILFPNVVILDNVSIGNHTIIKPGTIIGTDGFGFAVEENNIRYKIPHTGGVVIGSNVEIGANCTIDQGGVTPTVVKDHVKIDNMCHIAHNVTIGEKTVCAAQFAVAGSSTIGSNCLFGGKAAVTDHVSIVDNSFVAGGVGVLKSITAPGSYLGGVFPMQEQKDYIKNARHLRNLDALYQRIIALEKEMLEFKKDIK